MGQASWHLFTRSAENKPFVTSGDSWHLLHNHAGEKLAALFQPQLISMVPSTGTINVVESEKLKTFKYL